MLARLKIYVLFVNALFINPSLKQVLAGRQIRQPVSAVSLRAGEVRCVQHQDDASHVLVDFTIQFHNAGLVENFERWTIVFSIAPEVEAFRFGIRKHVVIEIVSIWKGHSRSNLDWEQSWTELHPQLQNFVRQVGRIGGCLGELALQVNHGNRRVGRSDFADLSRVPGRRGGQQLRLRQRDLALNQRLCRAGTRPQQAQPTANTLDYRAASHVQKTTSGKHAKR